MGTTQHFNRFYLSYFSCRANYSTIEWIVNTKSAGSHDINNIKQFTYMESASFDNRIILKYLSVLLSWEQTNSQICANAALVVSSMDMVDLNVTCRARDKNDTITVSRNQTMLSIHNETTSGNSEVDLVLKRIIKSCGQDAEMIIYLYHTRDMIQPIIKNGLMANFSAVDKIGKEAVCHLPNISSINSVAVFLSNHFSPETWTRYWLC